MMMTMHIVNATLHSNVYHKKIIFEIFLSKSYRLTTQLEVCVRTPITPPYGVMGKTCVVPRWVETATQRESKEKDMSVT